MKSKKLIIALGIILLTLGFVGLFKLLTMLQFGIDFGDGVWGLLGIVIYVVLDLYAGIYFIKNNDKIYAKLNVPAKPLFQKSLQLWFIAYVLILLSLIVMSEYINF